MKKIIALSLALAMLITTTAAIAGPRGMSRSGGGATSGNKMFRSTPSQPPIQQMKPGTQQGKTGTIQDLGLNPSARTPGDALKGKAGAPAGAGAQAGPQMPQSTAPAFGGSGGLFGGSWMSWAFLGYLFGRHQQPATHKAAGEVELVPDPD